MTGNKLYKNFGMHWVVILLLLTTPLSQAQTVVRLFSTPAERAELERQRLALYRPDLVQVAPQQAEPLIELPALAEPELPDVIYRMGGTMLRSDGLYTIWLNGEPINQEDLPDNMELMQPFAQGRLRIRNPATGTNYELKPGQVLNLTRGELFESYEYSGNEELSEAVDSVTDSLAEAANLESQNSDSN
ncbi:MAG: hypothetical protein MI746_00780 [Pseudomonadales bacterium]|nr:hypothetical protein [Pseudomonadales bacterium]